MWIFVNHKEKKGVLEIGFLRGPGVVEVVLDVDSIELAMRIVNYLNGGEGGKSPYYFLPKSAWQKLLPGHPWNPNEPEAG